MTNELLPKFQGMVHPKEGAARASAYFQVGPGPDEKTHLVHCPFKGACLVHCHGVDYKGGFVIFWVVSPQGLKKELWSTNQAELIIRQFEPSEIMLPHIPEHFGVFTWDIYARKFDYRQALRIEDSLLWRELEEGIRKEDNLRENAKMRDALRPFNDGSTLWEEAHSGSKSTPPNVGRPKDIPERLPSVITSRN